MSIEYLRRYFEKGSFNSSEEDYILTDPDLLNDNEIYYTLYPKEEINKVPKHRDAAMHLYLWDLNYYSRMQRQSSIYEECFRVHQKWWSDRTKKEIKKCLDEQNEKLSNLLFGIIKHWSFLRDDLFSEDFKQKEECETVDDYNRFIESHPQTYPEYLLEAKYRIAKLTDSVFEDASKAINEYPDSDWVKELRQRCSTTTAGITYMISEDLFVKREDKDIIVSFLEDFVKVESNDHKIIVMCKNIITERLWNAVMKQSVVFRSNLSIPKLMTFEEAEDFIKNLRHLVCVKLRMPTVEEWESCACSGDESHLFSGGNDIENVAVFSGNSDFSLQPVKSKKSNKLGIYDMSGNAWEWCQSESEELNIAPIKGGDFTSPQEWCEISATKYVPKSCYAGCRLVLDY